MTKIIKAMLVVILALGPQVIRGISGPNNPSEYIFALPIQQTGDYKIYLPLVVKEEMPLSLYNRVAAVSYADQWGHTRNGNYPNFGSGCSCNDCTNYASQVLREGNYPLRTGDWDPSDVSEWWYKKVMWWYENSNTWSATDWFNTYGYQFPDEFEMGNFWALTDGDFLVMDTRQMTAAAHRMGYPITFE